MQLTEQLALIDIFMREAMAKRAEAKQLASFDLLLQREKKRDQEEKHDRERLKEFDEAVMATAEQLDTFYVHLDKYDTATVQALMDNDRALDQVRHEREHIEASAYHLPDGTVAFKNEAGTLVYDRRGALLPRDRVHPDAIPDTAPRWEAMTANLNAEQKLAHGRQDILRYQQRLDDARDTVGQGKMTADALDKLDGDLKLSMPDAVKLRLPGATPEPESVMASNQSTMDQVARPSAYPAMLRPQAGPR